MSSKDHVEGLMGRAEHLIWCPVLCGLRHVPGGELVLSRAMDDVFTLG